MIFKKTLKFIDKLKVKDRMKMNNAELPKGGKQPVFYTEIDVYKKHKDDLSNSLGELQFTGHNHLVLPGAIFVAQKLTNGVSPITGGDSSQYPLTVAGQLSNQPNTSNLTTQYTSPNNTLTQAQIIANSTVCLFGVGLSGASESYGDIYPVNFNTKAVLDNPWTSLTQGSTNNLFPIRIVPTNSTELDGNGMLPGYAVRQSITYNNKNYYAFLFKEMGQGKILGTINNTGAGNGSVQNIPADFNNPEYDNSDMSICISFSISVSAKDAREYFSIFDPGTASGAGTNSAGLANARINTLALLFACPVQQQVAGQTNSSNTFIEYDNIQLFSKLNFNNQPLDNDTTVLNIEYKIYIV